MTKKKSSPLLLFLVLLLFWSSQAQAHRVRIFAYENGGTIFTEAKFSGGKPAKNSEILVQVADTNTILLTGHTNEEGTFSFPVPEKAKNEHLALDIIINVGEGHKNQWRLSAEEYLGGSAKKISPTPSITKREPANEKAPLLIQVDDEQLQKIIENALDEKLAPIKRMLVENRDRKPGIRDILGGIGYILGLAGIGAYFHSKKKNGE